MEPVTPKPAQTPSVMAPVGKPAAAHLGPPVGIPSGMSQADMMQQMQQMQEQIARLMALNAPQEETPREEKTYFHQTPGSTFVITRKGSNGESIPEVVTFLGGKVTTSDPDVQDFLDKIVDRPGVPIYTVAGAPDDSAKKAAAEVVANAAKSIDKLGVEAGTKG